MGAGHRRRQGGSRLLTDEGCRLCLCLTGENLARDLEIAGRYRGRVDMVELRADLLGSAELVSIGRFPSLAGLPAILTLRRRREGGGFRGSEARRRSLLRQGLEGGYAGVELEEDLRDPGLAAAARQAGTAVIRACRPPEGVPGDLAARLRRLPHAPGEIPVATVAPRGSEDMVRLVRASRELGGLPRILVATGEHGLFTHVLAPRLGSRLAYCSPPGPDPAPGQLDPEALLELYRFRGIDERTLVCGVIGNPISHSRSPHIHNRGYAALGLNAVYVPFLVDRVESFFELAELLELAGFSVTMPFKEQVIPLLAERDPAVAAIGACNTVVRRGPAKWFGTNTDAAGFLAPLRSRAPELLDGGASTRALVIGAGGAARSVVYALVGQGLRPLVLNRTVSRARRLGEEFGCPWGALGPEGLAVARGGGDLDLIVQTTSAGMGADRGVDPLPGYRFSGCELVYELVYDPPITPLLARAAAAGCRTVSGLQMLAAQAEEQFLLYTGHGYPAAGREGSGG